MPAAGLVPDAAELDRLFDSGFFLPAANKVAHRNLKEAARRLVDVYASEHADDLFRIWETERPFGLHLEGITISGRADVILDQEDGIPTGLAILDYKTAVAGNAQDHALQLQVYADAGRRENLEVRGAYVHDLKGQARTAVDVSTEAITTAEAVVATAAGQLRRREFQPNPGDRCRTCEVRTVCPSGSSR